MKAFAAALLAICTTAEVLCYSYLHPQPSFDENKCSITTVNFLVTHHRPILFNYSSAYMAPVLESVVAPYCALTKTPALPAIRFAGAVFLGLSTWMLFLVLTLEFSMGVSAAVTIAYGLATPWLLFAKSQLPGYPAGLFACFAFLYIALRFRPRPLRLGLLSGALYYIFPGSIAFIAALFIIRFLRLAAFNNIREDLVAKLRNRPIPRVISLFALSLVLLLDCATAYRVLVGQTGGNLGHALIGVAAISSVLAFFLLASFVYSLSPKHLQAPRSAVLRPMAFVLGFLAVELPVILIFRFIEMPYFASRGVSLWAGNSYAWKAWLDWPAQVSAYFGRVLPQALAPVGERDWTIVYSGFEWPHLRIALSVIAVGAVLWVVLRSKQSRSLRTKGPGVIFLSAFACMSAIMLPSWRLFGDPSVRYLTPYFPALYLGIALFVQDSIRRIIRRPEVREEPRILNARLGSRLTTTER
jgi:hypothetical protein